ncbi:MAG: cyanobactin biosynthesis PatC/TenC/TruC family protein [Crocosphaera sp.]
MTTQTETLWQIGCPGKGGKEFVQLEGWQAEFTYRVGTDADPIHAPQLPSLLVDPNRQTKPKGVFATDKLNICFTLERSYKLNELTLFYDFLGAETDTLTLDGQPLAQINGLGEGKLKQNQIPLPVLAVGKHTLTITTATVNGDGVHWIDYFKLEGLVSSVPKTMTGLQDYSYWWQYARKQANLSGTDQKAFRRGRIWA